MGASETESGRMSLGEFSLDSLKMLVVVGLITLVGNRIGYGIGLLEALPGMALIVAIGLASLLLGRLLPLDLPAFAYAMIIAFLIALPFSPVQEPVLAATGQIDFLATTTPILAYAGLSIGLQTARMKEVSWKLVLVAVFVFFGTFFGSAVIAQVVLSLQGVI
ncbi:hypothetical protein [Halomarina pelagica]|uniref:hypothetical protein n=1 Tax=Halomarina pelagica TaxID=2961599 RepID=UPI0020C287AE|nr:hypothetical protein [Halomarina sp. BND7]